MVCVDSTWISTAQISVCSSTGNPNWETRTGSVLRKVHRGWAGWSNKLLTAPNSYKKEQPKQAHAHHAKTGETAKTT